MKLFIKGGFFANVYHWTHPQTTPEQIPYWFKRSIIEQVGHIIRKWVCQVWAPNCAITQIRLWLYRLCGFKIGKGTFIGMKCYLDDLCVKEIEIGANVTISYGVYFSCHGPKQGHNKLIIKDGVYIGMRSCIIARNDLVIGEDAIIGAMTLVNRSVNSGATIVGG